TGARGHPRRRVVHPHPLGVPRRGQGPRRGDGRRGAAQAAREPRVQADVRPAVPQPGPCRRDRPAGEAESMSAQQYDEQYAADRAAIEDLMARYLFALDYNDLDSFIETFTDDAEFEFARGRIAGKANILEAVKGFKKRIGEHYKDEDGNPAVLRHVLAHTAIRVVGDRAWTRAQWFEMAN